MIGRSHLSIVILLAACAPSGPVAEPGPAPRDQRLPGSLTANVVIEGTVADTAPGRAVIAVASVARAPGSLGDLRGRRVTVVLAADDRPDLGERVTVFGAVLAAGGTLTIRQVLRLAAPIEELRTQIVRAEQEQLDSILADRMRRAERVVYGRVILVVDSSAADPRDSEHNPLWHVAVVQVRETLKGPTARSTEVWFPSSSDVMWVQSPRFAVGQEGVWILQRSPPLERLTALGRWDFQPAAEVARLRRLRPNR